MATDSCKFLEMVRGVIGRKIVVCSFTEDFGRATKEKYQKLGETLSKSADILYFVSSQQSKFASSSVSFRNKKSRFLISTAADIEDSLRKKLHKNDVCLFVGEHADQLFDKFT